MVFTNSDNGQAFGQELFFWLVTGPNRTAFLVVAGIIAFALLISIVVGVVIGIRRLLRRIRRRPRPALS